MTEDERKISLYYKKFVYCDYIEVYEKKSSITELGIIAIATLSNNSKERVIDFLDKNLVISGTLVLGFDRKINSKWIDSFVSSLDFINTDYVVSTVNQFLNFFSINEKIEFDGFRVNNWFETQLDWLLFTDCRMFEYESNLSSKFKNFSLEIIEEFIPTKMLKYVPILLKDRFFGFDSVIAKERIRFLDSKSLIDVKDSVDWKKDFNDNKLVSMSGHAYKLVLLSGIVPFYWNGYLSILNKNGARFSKVYRTENSLNVLQKNIKEKFNPYNSDSFEAHYFGLWHNSREWELGFDFGCMLLGFDQYSIRDKLFYSNEVSFEIATLLLTDNTDNI